MVVSTGQQNQQGLRFDLEHGERLANHEGQLTELRRQLTELRNAQIATASVVPDLPNIGQLWRNSDCCFSIDGWHNATVTAGDQQKELGVMFTHVADPQVTVYDGVIAAGTLGQFDSATAAFVAGDVGKIIIIDGAGTAGARHATTIATYVNANRVTLTAPAVTAVTAARARYRCLKLGKLSKKTSAATVTDVIKEPTHSQWATNIQSPKWDVPSGSIHWGGNTNRITHFLAYVLSSGVFVPQIQPLQGGRSLHVQFRFALKNKFIKPKGLLYAALFDNSDIGLEPLYSSDFTITGTVQGVPVGTATTQYFIVAETDEGDKYVSRICSVANAPDINSYNPPSVQVRLSWKSLPGVIKQTIYRKIGAGNVFLLEALDSNLGEYIDVNTALRTDTGSGAFPAIAFALSHSRCYAETSDFVGLREEGNGDWAMMRLIIPFTSYTSLGTVTELAVTIGVTEPAAFEAPVTTVAGNNHVLNAENPFVAGMNGLNVIVRDKSDDNLYFTTTITAWTAGDLTLAAPVPWNNTVNPDTGISNTTIEIPFTDPYAYISDCFGISLNRGKWTTHEDDTNRLLPPASLPTQSNQGGVGGGGDGPPGGGGIDCMHEDGIFETIDGPMPGYKLVAGEEGTMVWFGIENRYNRIAKITRTLQKDYLKITSKKTGKVSYGTEWHRLVAGLENRRYGTAIPDLTKREKVLLVIEKECILDAIEVEEIHDPEGKWFLAITFDHDPDRPIECHLGICDGFMFHNRKIGPGDNPTF